MNKTGIRDRIGFMYQLVLVCGVNAFAGFTVGVYLFAAGVIFLHLVNIAEADDAKTWDD